MPIKTMSVLKWALLLAASLVLAFVMYALAQWPTDVVPEWWIKCLVSVAVSGVMVTLYALFVKWIEREPAKDIPRQKIFSDTAKGFGVGAGFITTIVLVMLAAGLCKITGVVTDQVTGIITAFFYFILVAVGEEIIFRGVLFRWIDEKWGFVTALVTSAILFGAMHMGQPNATWWSSLAIAIEAGLMLGAAYKWSGTLWFPIGIHWARNFFQGNIFGFAVSGSDAGMSLLHSVTSGPEILTGGSFGAEASIITVILGAILSAWFIFKARVR